MTPSHLLFPFLPTFDNIQYLHFQWSVVGRADVPPAEARFGAFVMLLLSALATVVAGIVFSSGSTGQGALFAGLAILGAWQTSYYWRQA